jgi:hypothetical protein
VNAATLSNTIKVFVPFDNCMGISFRGRKDSFSGVMVTRIGKTANA